MRLALPGLALALSTLPLSADTATPFSHVSESTVTLAATYSRRENNDNSRSIRNSNGDYTVFHEVSAVRFGNSDLLDVLVATELIEEKRGWTLVAIWADWPRSDNSDDPYGVSYRFFVRKKTSSGYDTRAVPPERLRFKLLAPYVTKEVKKNATGDILSGTDRFKAYSRLFIGAEAPNPDAAEKDRPIAESTSLGMVGGSGSYVRPATATASFYLPNAASFTGYSEIVAATPEDSEVVLATLKLAKAVAVPSSRYPAFEGTEPSLGPDATVVTSTEETGGVLTLSSGTVSLDGDTGGTTLIGGDLSVSTGSEGGSGTLVLGAAM